MDEKENKIELSQNILKVYFKAEKENKNIESNILENEELIKELADMWTQHETAIKTLIKVINAETAKYMIEDALPDELVPLRHELFGAEKVLVKLEKYANESERREKRAKPTEEESLDNSSPPVENTPQEGEEGSL